MIVNNVIHATYANYRRVQGRKTLQLILEVPIEAATSIHNLLGEPDVNDEQVQVGLVRLDPEGLNAPVEIGVGSTGQAPSTDGSLVITEYLDQ